MVYRHEDMNDDLKNKLQAIRHLALDMDGTLYNGKTLFPYTPRALALAEECGIGYTYLTNNSSRSVDAYVEKLLGLGLKASREQIYTSSLATLDYLREQYPAARSIFVFGTESLRQEFEQAGYRVVREDDVDEPELVVVGFDTTLTYRRMCRAAWWIKQGKPFIATHPDWVCPTDQPEVLVDCGSVCAALTAATGVKPLAVLGKPDPRMLTGILAKHRLAPHELAMVGDRIYTDMAMAQKSGALGVLVLSGETRKADIDSTQHGEFVVAETILEFVKQLLAAKK